MRQPQTNQLNPNQLKGHEGKLLQTTKSIEVFANFVGEGNPDDVRSSYVSPHCWAIHKEIRRGTVVMYVASKFDPEYGLGWIDILHDGQRLRMFINVSQWMLHFIPWPRGGFVS